MGGVQIPYRLKHNPAQDLDKEPNQEVATKKINEGDETTNNNLPWESLECYGSIEEDAIKSRTPPRTFPHPSPSQL